MHIRSLKQTGTYGKRKINDRSAETANNTVKPQRTHRPERSVLRDLNTCTF